MGKHKWPDDMPFPWDQLKSTVSGGIDPSLHNLGWAALDLHKRLDALENLDMDDRDTFEELEEIEHSKLALRCFASESSHAIMMKMWRTEKRARAKLQKSVDEFVKWAEGEDGEFSNLYSPSDILGKLRELGLVEK